MKLTISTGEIEVQCPKGGEIKRMWKMLAKSLPQSGEQNLEAWTEYLDYVDEVSAVHSGLTVEQLDDLSEDDKNVIIGYVAGKAKDRMDFLKPSQQQAS